MGVSGLTLRYEPVGEALSVRDVLFVADVHVGVEIELKKKGIRVPDNTENRITKLETLIKISEPNTIVVVGDLKHTVAGMTRYEEKSVCRLVETLLELVDELIIVKGNHDGRLEAILRKTEAEVVGTRGIVVNHVYAFHGHASPDPEALEKANLVVMGHEHPVSNDVPGVTLKTFLEAVIDVDAWTGGRLDGEIEAVYLPAVDDLVGGTPLDELGLTTPFSRGAVLDFSTVPVIEPEPWSGALTR